MRRRLGDTIPDRRPRALNSVNDELGPYGSCMSRGVKYIAVYGAAIGWRIHIYYQYRSAGRCTAVANVAEKGPTISEKYQTVGLGSVE